MKISLESLKSPFGRRNPRKTRPRESLRLQRISELQNSEVWDDGYQAFIGFPEELFRLIQIFIIYLSIHGDFPAVAIPYLLYWCLFF